MPRPPSISTNHSPRLGLKMERQKSASGFGMTSANNSLLAPYPTITCRAGHMHTPIRRGFPPTPNTMKPTAPAQPRMVCPACRPPRDRPPTNFCGHAGRGGAATTRSKQGRGARQSPQQNPLKNRMRAGNVSRSVRIFRIMRGNRLKQCGRTSCSACAVAGRSRLAHRTWLPETVAGPGGAPRYFQLWIASRTRMSHWAGLAEYFDHDPLHLCMPTRHTAQTTKRF